MDGMLDRMRPTDMDALEAYDNVHGIGLARLFEIVNNGFVQLILTWSDEKDVDIEKLRKTIDPWLQR